MKLEPVNKETTGRKTKYASVITIVEEFINSDSDVMEVEYSNAGYLNARSCYGSFWSSISRKRYAVSVVRQGEHIFLKKLDYCPYKNNKS